MNALPQVLSLARPSLLLFGLATLPEVGFVLQAASVGTLVGGLVALRAKRRYARVDTWVVTTAWTGLGLLVGLVTTAVVAIA